MKLSSSFSRSNWRSSSPFLSICTSSESSCSDTTWRGREEQVNWCYLPHTCTCTQSKPLQASSMLYLSHTCTCTQSKPLQASSMLPPPHMHMYTKQTFASLFDVQVIIERQHVRVDCLHHMGNVVQECLLTIQRPCVIQLEDVNGY